MRTAIVTLAVLVIVGLGAYGGYEVGLRTQGAEIARIASVNAERSARIRSALNTKQSSDAKDLLDVAIGQDLFYMQMFEKAALSDQRYARQRGRSVAVVKQSWLESPPFSLEDETRSFIDTVCSQANSCPSGSIRPGKGQQNSK